MKKRKGIISLVITVVIATSIVILETRAIGIWQTKQNDVIDKKTKNITARVDKSSKQLSTETYGNKKDKTQKASTASQNKEEPKPVENVQVQAQPVQKQPVNYVGCNELGDLYSYNAKEIQQRILTKNYSNNGQKMVFLTFDDGPSLTVTPKILDILDSENVKATFMVTGNQIAQGGEKAKELIKREFNSGNAIGNHSYSHNYSILYPGRVLNLDNFLTDFSKNDTMLKNILGDNFSTNVIRCPGGYMSWQGMSPLSDYLNANNKAYIDWNALSGDAEPVKRNADQLVQYAEQTSQGKDIVVILMHDTYGKEETANSLMRIIEYFKSSGYQFRTLV